MIFVKIGDSCTLFKSMTEYLSMLYICLTDLAEVQYQRFSTYSIPFE